MSWSLLAGATAGLGVWATHFVAMTAYDVGLPMRFEVSAADYFRHRRGRGVHHDVLARAQDGRYSFARHCWRGAGLSIILTEFIGTSGVVVAADIHWDIGLVWVTWTSGLGLSALAAYAYYREQTMMSALRAGGIFMASVTGAHFAAVSAMFFVQWQRHWRRGRHHLAPIDRLRCRFGLLRGARDRPRRRLARHLSVRPLRQENARLRDNVRAATAELALFSRNSGIARPR